MYVSPEGYSINASALYGLVSTDSTRATELIPFFTNRRMLHDFIFIWLWFSSVNFDWLAMQYEHIVYKSLKTYTF